MVVCILFLAGKDATSFKLKDKAVRDKELEEKRIKRWHRDGVALNILFVLPFLYFDPINWWQYISLALLLRLSIYDIGFNYWAGLNYKFLGSTALWDRIFVKIFGLNGAVKKSITFLVLTVLLMTIKLIL